MCTVSVADFASDFKCAIGWHQLMLEGHKCKVMQLKNEADQQATRLKEHLYNSWPPARLAFCIACSRTA